MAASVCLAPQALADQAPTGAAAHSATTAQTATVDAARIHVGMTSAQLISAVQQATGQKPDKARRASYTVRSGDSLSKIAGKFYHKQNAWPVLYWANHKKIRWANLINEGQVLKVPVLPAKIPAAPSQLGPVAPAPAPVSSAPAPVQATASTSSSSSYSGRSTYSGSSTYSGAASGSYEACVIARESGGNAQVMNSSGHYGLYQFSASTWEAYGGSAASFGHASAAEQHRVFANAMAQGGQSNWSPYDGC